MSNANETAETIVAARLDGAAQFYRRHPYRRQRRAFAILLAAVATSAACRQDMHDQPRYRPLADSSFFADKRASRPLVPGTIARGHLRTDTRYFAGREGAAFVTELPVKLTRDLLLRGQDRYDIFCSPCHGRAGDGEGMVVQRGFRHPPSFHQERLYNQPVGHYYDVIANGFGAMASYASRIPVGDRWAIVAYIRVLQLSQNATIDDVPAAERPALQAARNQPPGEQQR
jgi:hypothetical protein